MVRRLDLYDLLLRGDTRDDAKLLPGTSSSFRRWPRRWRSMAKCIARRSTKSAATPAVADIVQLAGGLTTGRPTPAARHWCASTSSARAWWSTCRSMARAGAVSCCATAIRCESCVCGRRSIRVSRWKAMSFSPAPVAWHEGLRLTDVIGSVDELKPNADLNYVLVRRELPPDRRVVMLSADLAAALRDPASPKNIALDAARPHHRVRHRVGSPASCSTPLLEEMRRQSRIDQPSEIVRIDGRVKARGDYPLEPSMRVSDLLRAGGGLQDAAYGAKAELTRYRVEQRRARRRSSSRSTWRPILRGDESRGPDAAAVRFPERQGSAGMERAGAGHRCWAKCVSPVSIPSSVARRCARCSIAPAASPRWRSRAAPYSRASNCKDREQEQLDRLAERLQSDLAVDRVAGGSRKPGPGRPGADRRPVTADTSSRRPRPSVAWSSILTSVLDSPVGSPMRRGVARRRSAHHSEAEAGSDGHRRGAEHHLALLSRKLSRATTTSVSAAV